MCIYIYIERERERFVITVMVHVLHKSQTLYMTFFVLISVCLKEFLGLGGLRWGSLLTLTKTQRRAKSARRSGSRVWCVRGDCWRFNISEGDGAPLPMDTGKRHIGQPVTNSNNDSNNNSNNDSNNNSNNDSNNHSDNDSNNNSNNDSNKHSNNDSNNNSHAYKRGRIKKHKI